MKLAAFLKKDSTAEFKAITSEYRELYQIQKERLKELEEMKTDDKTLQEYIERETEYHQRIIELIQENRDLKERLLFELKIKNGKHKT